VQPTKPLNQPASFKSKSVTAPMNCTSREAGLTVSRRTTGSKRKQKYSERKSNPTPKQQRHRSSEKNYEIKDRWKTSLEYFRLEHPPDRLILCNRSDCKDIADYPEVNEHGSEDFVCATHTSSERHASVLPNGLPSGDPHRSRPAA
jgi:hypothetical protein